MELESEVKFPIGSRISGFWIDFIAYNREKDLEELREALKKKGKLELKTSE